MGLRILSKFNSRYLINFLMDGSTQHPVFLTFQIRPALSSHIKVDEVGDVLKDAPEKLADSIILFSQVRFTVKV